MADNSLRWYLDMAFEGVRVVGKVWQTAAPETGTKGGMRPAAPWVAVGMGNAWADTDLGASHSTRADAMRAVAEWWAARAAAPSIDPAKLHPPIADWVTKAISGLRLVQWGGPYKTGLFCPACDRTATSGHAEACALWAALKMVPPE